MKSDLETPPQPEAQAQAQSDRRHTSRARPGRGAKPKIPAAELRRVFEESKSQLAAADLHLKRTGVMVVRAGRILYDVKHRRMFRLDGYATFKEWLQAEYGKRIREGQAQKYISCHDMEEQQVEGLDVGVNDTVLLGRSPDVRDLLLEIIRSMDLTNKELVRVRNAGRAKRKAGGSPDEVRRVMLAVAQLGDAALPRLDPAAPRGGRKLAAGLLLDAFKLTNKLPSVLTQLRARMRQRDPTEAADVRNLLGLATECMHQMAEIAQEVLGRDEVAETLSTLLALLPGGPDGDDDGGGGGGDGGGGDDDAAASEPPASAKSAHDSPHVSDRTAIPPVLEQSSPTSTTPSSAEWAAELRAGGTAARQSDQEPAGSPTAPIESAPIESAQDEDVIIIDDNDLSIIDDEPAQSDRPPAPRPSRPPPLPHPAAAVAKPAPAAEPELPPALVELLEPLPPAEPEPLDISVLRNYIKAFEAAEGRLRDQEERAAREAFEDKIREKLRDLGCDDTDIYFALQMPENQFRPAGQSPTPETRENPASAANPADPAAPSRPSITPGLMLPDNGQEYLPLPPIPGPPITLPEDWGHATRPAPIFRASAIAGTSRRPGQAGLFGTRVGSGDPLLFSSDDPISSIFLGVTGSGKSYAAFSMAEIGLFENELLGNLKVPHCVIHLPYPNAGYPPEILDSVHPNHDPTETKKLLEVYRIAPEGLGDMVILTMPEQVARRRRQELHAQVHGLKFALRDLGGQGLILLLGVDENKSPLYAKQVLAMLKDMRRRIGHRDPTWADLIRAIGRFHFDPTVRRFLFARLRLMHPFVDDRKSLLDYIRGGRTLVLDIRDRWLSTEMAYLLHALATHALLLNEARLERGIRVPLVPIWDEGHQNALYPRSRSQIITGFREKRHLGLSPRLISQSPSSLPGDTLALTDVLGVFQHDSHGWNRYLGEAIQEFRGLSADITGKLIAGVGIFWIREWFMLDPTLPHFNHRLHLLDVRPRLSLHGGATRRAVQPEDEP